MNDRYPLGFGTVYIYTVWDLAIGTDFLPLTRFMGLDNHRAHHRPFKNQIENLVFSHFVIDFSAHWGY